MTSKINNIKNLTQLCTNFVLVDVTLVSEDLQQLTAHKVVLSSCSPVLKYLLKSRNHPHPVLFLKGARFRNLEYILEFIYSGQVDIPQEHLNDFLQLAQDLKLKGISTENQDLKREQKDRNIFVAEDEDISTEIFEEGLVPFEDSQIVKSLNKGVLNDVNKENEFASTIAFMMEKFGKMWRCKVCLKEVTSNHKTNLKEHVETTHLTGFTHICDLCKKTCSTQSALRNHKQRYHKMSINIQYPI